MPDTFQFAVIISGLDPTKTKNHSPTPGTSVGPNVVNFLLWGSPALFKSLYCWVTTDVESVWETCLLSDLAMLVLGLAGAGSLGTVRFRKIEQMCVVVCACMFLVLPKDCGYVHSW